MRVLIACEFSGIVRRAFKALGHDAISCDLLPSEDNSPHHHQCDIFDLLDQMQGRGIGEFDLMIAHPPCTFLCSSGLHWNKRRPDRAEQTAQAIEFAKRLFTAKIPRIAMENPIGCLSTYIRKPDQIIQPYHYGEDASKATCLWLKNLPLLRPTKFIEPRIIDGKNRWANQTDSGQNKLAPSADRWKERSLTYQGIADAMAAQWGEE